MNISITLEDAIKRIDELSAQLRTARLDREKAEASAGRSLYEIQRYTDALSQERDEVARLRGALREIREAHEGDPEIEAIVKRVLPS